MMVAAALIGLVMGVGVVDEPEKVPSTLIRWSADEPMVGQVREVDDQGVRIKIGDQIIQVVVPWFDVRSLEPIGTKYTEYQQLAEDAWRAHTRLIRGDYAGAEAIYNSLEAKYLWKSGAQAADVSMGLVRCRLDRGDRVRAVVPFLSWLGAVRSDRARVDEDAVGFDSKYGLLIDLAPIFGPSAHGRVLPMIGESSSILDRQRVLFGYYQLALDQDIHRTPQAERVLDELRVMARVIPSRDVGLALIEEIVIAQSHPDSGKRSSARAALDRRIRSNSDTWIELWARLGNGVSLLGEDDTESNERGVIELIHVIVRLESISQPLAELAAEIANDYLVRTDRTQWGSMLMFQARIGVAQGHRE